jgi:hypothetical protein
MPVLRAIAFLAMIGALTVVVQITKLLAAVLS